MMPLTTDRRATLEAVDDAAAARRARTDRGQAARAPPGHGQGVVPARAGAVEPRARLRRRRGAGTPTTTKLCDGARSALFLNILTEDNLPHYYRQINGKFGNDDVWGEWNRRWTAEEGRHAIVIRDYLAVTRSIDMRELERARMRQVSMGHRARTPTPSPTASSTSRCRSSPPASRTATPASCSTTRRARRS